MAKLALVFPGQGSQLVGMGRAMAESYPAAAALYRQADELLDWSVSELSFNGPLERLSQTEFAQVALYVCSSAIAAVLGEAGLKADVVSGHSLGEYSALAAAGAVSFADGLKLVAQRGQLMAQAAQAEPGAMAAILGLADEQVEAICDANGGVWPVNYNSPGQLVISGSREGVAAAMAQALAAGAKRALELPVSGAFHSPLMGAAAAAMESVLAGCEFREPVPTFFSSISCRQEPAAALPALLVKQITAPVRWSQTVAALRAEGVDRFLEVGSGKVLCGLIRRIAKEATAISVSDPTGWEQARALLAEV